MWSEAFEVGSLLLVLLNPFALSVYLMDLMRELELRSVIGVMVRAGLVSAVVFVVFAWTGDQIFRDVLHVRFASFQVFGGLVFLLIAMRFMLGGSQTFVVLRGEPEHLAGTVAMPFMIGPATISGAIIAGARLDALWAIATIAVVVVSCVGVLIVLKVVFDGVRARNVKLVERYVDIMGRVAALLAGTIAVDMIFQGLERWLTREGGAVGLP
ncbi:MAG: MarC family protein [Myxococcota bacterium]